MSILTNGKRFKSIRIPKLIPISIKITSQTKAIMVKDESKRSEKVEKKFVL
jgi:hypothetical protein